MVIPKQVRLIGSPAPPAGGRSGPGRGGTRRRPLDGNAPRPFPAENRGERGGILEPGEVPDLDENIAIVSRTHAATEYR